MEKIREWFKNLKPWQIFAIIGVSILGVFAYFRNSARESVEEVTPVPLTTYSGGGATSTDSTSTSGNTLGSTIIDSLTQTLKDQQDAYEQRFENMTEQIEAQQDLFNETFDQLTSAFESYQNNTNSVIGKVQDSFESLKSSQSKEPAPDINISNSGNSGVVANPNSSSSTNKSSVVQSSSSSKSKSSSSDVTVSYKTMSKAEANETIRKAQSGISLTDKNPSKEKQDLYNKYKK